MKQTKPNNNYMKTFFVSLLLTILANYSFSQTSGCSLGNCQNGWGVYEWKTGSNNGDKYVGEFKDGYMEGYGVYTWHSGEKYVGAWVKGLQAGYGTQYYADGTKSSGYWLDSKVPGTKYTSAACIGGDCENGYGVWVYDSGDMFLGNFKDGYRSGLGTYLYANGEKYVGNYENNKRNGNGLYNWTDGSYYSGDWKDGNQEGYGTYITTTGTVQTGTFANGSYVGASTQTSSTSSSGCIAGNCDDGWGVYEWTTGASSGDKYIGEWKGGYRNGEGVYTWHTGDKYVGTWANGKINGYGTQFYASGTKSCGYWADAVLSGTNFTPPACISGDCVNGYGVWVFDNGDKYTGYWKDGFRSGEGTYLYADGQKYVGAFELNKRSGYGNYNWVAGSSYAGNWKDGNQNGYGVYTGTDGKIQTGYYVDGNYSGTTNPKTEYIPSGSSSCITGDCENGWGIYEWKTGSNNGDKYIGEWKNGNREGDGVYTWNNGDKYVGGWSGGIINGYGTQYYANGTKSCGNWQNAKLVGTNYTDPACLTGDCNNGYGTWIYDSGDKYTGYFKDSYRSGQGTYLYNDGEKYVGNFENNKRNGFGSYFWTDGSFYVGTWKDGNQEGSGSYTKVDGTKQVGKFEKGSFIGESGISENPTSSLCSYGDCNNGFGIYTWGEGNWVGDKYIGDWKDGYMSGEGYYSWHGGSKYIGSWLTGKQSGYGTQFYADGTKSIGLFKDGKLSGTNYSSAGCISGNCTDGYGVWIYDDGAKYEGYWNSGKISGQGTFIFADGMKYDGNFDNGKRNGYGTFYWNDGSNHIGNWKDDNQDGTGIYTKADGTVQKGYWANGVFKGEVDESKNKIFIADKTNLISKENINNFANKKASLSDRIKVYVEEKVNQWQQKGEFEKTLEYKNRVNETSRSKKIEEFQKEAIVALKKDFKETINYANIKLGLYDADNESFLLTSDELGEFVVPIPVADAPNFKKNFSTYKFNNADFYIKDNSFALAYAEIVNPTTKKKYIFDSKNSATYATTSINYKFNEIVIDVEDKAGGISSNIKKGTNSISVGKSDVDFDVPVNSIVRSNTYALIIGNEDYSTYQPGLSTEVNVDFAANDAKIFKEYCVKTLGIPEKQIKLLINGTSAQMNQAIAWLTNLAKVEEGNAELLFYYSGHGLPDEQTKEGYLIPVDVSGSNANQGVKLNELYAKLNEFPSKKVSVFLDACFSGGARNQGLIAMKGVKVKPKDNVVNGNMVVLTSSTGEESSGVYREKQHGYMTYFLLKNLQETKGNISYKDLANSVISSVKKETALSGKVQTPQLNYSTAVDGTWESWKVK
jgi:hypothetical protein